MSVNSNFAIDGWLCERRFGDRAAGLATRTDKYPSHCVSCVFLVSPVLLLAMCCPCNRQLKVCPQESLWAPAGIERPRRLRCITSVVSVGASLQCNRVCLVGVSLHNTEGGAVPWESPVWPSTHSTVACAGPLRCWQ